MVLKFIPKKLLTLVIVSEILIGSWALGFIAWALWNRPLGPSMGLPKQTQEPAVRAIATNSPVLDSQGAGNEPGVTPTPSTIMGHIASLLKPPATHPPKGQCGAPAVMYFIVIGSDNRDPYAIYGLSDSMHLIRIDTVNLKMMVLDLPRDLWVEIPGLADHGITHGKLNQAYAFGNPYLGLYDDPGEGPGLLARTLALNYGVTQIDHYVAANMHTFVNVVDSVGGVDIYLPYRVDLNQGQDGVNPDYVYEPGSYHLDGERALMFARLRIPTIFQRARFQEIILKGLEAKLLSPYIIPEIPNLISQFSQAVQTDLSPNDIQQLVCLSQKITTESTQFVAFPDEMFGSDSTYDSYRKVNTYTLAVDNNKMREYLAAFMQGTWPEQ